MLTLLCLLHHHRRKHSLHVSVSDRSLRIHRHDSCYQSAEAHSFEALAVLLCMGYDSAAMDLVVCGSCPLLILNYNPHGDSARYARGTCRVREKVRFVSYWEVGVNAVVQFNALSALNNYH